jgi:hypothetical protein
VRREEGDMRQIAGKLRSDLVRIIAALVIVLAGVLVVSPSFNPDTDNDGVPDAHEISVGTDPAVPDAGDKLANRASPRR